MCGIAGVYAHGGGDVDREVVERMIGVIRHRGPDDLGVATDRGVALGTARLSIIDLAGGHQPMAGPDGSLVVAFNGEIYNYRELTADLRARGHQFRTASDTETILHLYEERGDSLVHDLRGMFALAVWDRARRRLLVARDRLGIKPLYYADRQGRLSFGSEIKSLLEDGVAPQLDPTALVQYLALKYVPAPSTMFAGVASLPPGHLLLCDAGGVRIRRWWNLGSRSSRVVPAREEEQAERLAGLLEQSVREHVVSDVPFGAFLSGGLDSSTVVALMSRVLDHPVRTFSVGYGGEDEAISELPFARMVAERYGTQHHEVLVGASDFVDLSERLVWHLDQPIADEATLPNYLVAELASHHVKMVLTGEGGDELFAGYARHSGERLAGAVQSLPRGVRSSAVALAEQLPGLRRPKLALYALAQEDEARRFVSWFTLFNDERLEALLTDEKRSADLGAPVRTFRRHLEDVDTRSALDRMLHLDTVLWLPDDLLARGDKTSMAASVEARLPLLDHRLVEFAATLPPHLKLRGRTRKYLLRKVAADWLPPAVITRKKKGFPTPVARWFRGEARTFLLDHLSPETVRRRGLFSPAYVQRLLDEHDRGFADHSSLLFGLLGVELWHRVFVDGHAPRAAALPVRGGSAS